MGIGPAPPVGDHRLGRRLITDALSPAAAGSPPTSDTSDTSGTDRPGPAHGRLRRILTVPAEVVATGLVLVVLQHQGLAGSLPLGVLLPLLAACGTANAVAQGLAGPGSTGWRLNLRVAVGMSATTVMIYAVGWGPTLAMGYAVIAVAELQQAGSAVWRPALVSAVAGLGAGEAAIATGLVPSYLSKSLMHGLAVLAALTLVVVISQLGGKTAAIEAEGARRSLAEQTLRRSEQRFRSLVQNAPDVVTLNDAVGTVTWVSANVEAVMGYRYEQMVGLRGIDLVHAEDLATLRGALEFVMAHPGETGTVEARVRHADGTWHWHEMSSRNELHDPAVAGIVTNHRDVSEARAYRDRLTEEATHDPLTGLANRKGFLDCLDQALAAGRLARSGIAVLFIDLDRFKLINDTLGHNVGDRVLVVAAERISRCLRDVDSLARLAGDEFTAVLDGMGDPAAARAVADRITESLSDPIVVGTRTVVVTASVGVAVSPLGDESTEELLCRADLAMYASKQAGRARSSVFVEGSTPQFTDRVDIETGLRSAVERAELVLHFQPIVTLPRGDVTGFEALVRWSRPGHGLLGPAAFVGVAEDTGLIVDIGAWVLRDACRTLAEWRRRRPSQPLVMNVNVSSVQLGHPGFVEDVARVLAETGLPPEALTLEITESVLLTGEATAGALHALHELGVRLALDDFGTGYSSLSYLRRLPVDIVKIDRAFVAELDRESADTAIVRAITDIAGRLGMTTIAEGVETEAQARSLTALGCGLAQGYFFGRAEPADIADSHLELPRASPYLAG